MVVYHFESPTNYFWVTQVASNSLLFGVIADRDILSPNRAITGYADNSEKHLLILFNWSLVLNMITAHPSYRSRQEPPRASDFW